MAASKPQQYGRTLCLEVEVVFHGLHGYRLNGVRSATPIEHYALRPEAKPPFARDTRRSTVA
jgi:hypothetical protein